MMRYRKAGNEAAGGLIVPFAPMQYRKRSTMKRINYITKENFNKYGIIIDFTGRPDNPSFEIIVKNEEDPWRIAMLRVEDREFTFLEKHPASLETFEPVEGVCLLLVSLETEPDEFEYFILDRPVCLNHGVWHSIITLTKVSKIKITENLEVDTDYYNLNEPLELFAASHKKSAL